MEFDALDDDTLSLLQMCRITLAVHSGCQLGTTIGLLIAIQAKWSEDDCSELNVYSSGDSILCEIGLPLFVFATFYIVVAMLMSLLGLYGAWFVRRLFLSIFLVLSISLVVFFLFTFTLVIAMAFQFVPFGIIPLLLLLFSGVPVVASALLLRFKSLDRDDVGYDAPSGTMLETVVVATTFPSGFIVGGDAFGSNESIFFASRRESPRDDSTQNPSAAPPPAAVRPSDHGSLLSRHDSGSLLGSASGERGGSPPPTSPPLSSPAVVLNPIQNSSLVHRTTAAAQLPPGAVNNNSSSSIRVWL